MPKKQRVNVDDGCITCRFLGPHAMTTADLSKYRAKGLFKGALVRPIRDGSKKK